MTNKFRSQRPLPVPQDVNDREPIRDLTKGLLHDRQARLLPPGYSPNLAHIRFEAEGLRKDFGSTAIGTAAPTRVLGIGEHKYILNEASYHRLIRLRLDGTQLALDIWDGTSWVETDKSAESIADTYLDIASMQNRFLIADGQYILTWYESAGTAAEQDDFPSGNSLTDEGDVTSATISPAGAIGNEYDVRYSVDLTITNGSDYTITVALKHNGTEVMTKEFTLASGNNSWTDQLFELIQSISDGDTLELEVKDIAADTRPQKSAAWAAGATYDYEATKTQDDVDQNGDYIFYFSIGGILTVDTNIRFYYDDGSGWTVITTYVYSSTGLKSETFSLGTLPSGTKFAMDRVSGDGELLDRSPGVAWEGVEAGIDFSLAVEGYNDPVDLDPYPGVSYTIETPVTSVLEQLSADAPAARFVLPFGDRLLAYRDGSDPQVASWSVDGDITDWTSLDSGSTVLLDTRSDGIDRLMGAAVLSASTVAVFRQRSIMRAQETGNVQLAMGHFHWIEGLGTESPFSITPTPAGILFLGHDLQVYLLTTNGPQPIGQAIHAKLSQDVTSNLEKVDAAYDGVFGEYMLGVPEHNASTITGVYIFELATYLEKQEAVWRYRPLNVERFANVSEIE